jgi:4-amino-4-deoxychorismate lyase
MSPLVETIKIKNGKLFNLYYHNLRFNRSRSEYFGISDRADLEQIIKIPSDKKEGLYRCRVIYSPEIVRIEFHQHTIKEIRTLKLIEADTIEYCFKYLNRKPLQKLYDMRGDSGDILIIKNGHVTDSFTANVIFFDGKKWYTPDTPLLQGIMRAKLLNENKILERRITINDLKKYKTVGLINALQDFDEMPVLDMKSVTGI